MQKLPAKSRISYKVLCVILLFILCANVLFSAKTSSITNNNELKEELNLVPHEAIRITNDGNFIDYGFSGNGSEVNPYVIENYEIISTDEVGIYVSSTSKSFIIQNCYIDALDYGISINYLVSGKVQILNNTCVNSNIAGLYVLNSDDVSIVNNTCMYNEDGMSLIGSQRVFLDNNTCLSNFRYGFQLYDLINSTIQNNLVQSNLVDGILIWGLCSNLVLKSNILINSGTGIYGKLLDSFIENNTFSDNSNTGLYLEDSDKNIISANNIFQNGYYGLIITDSDSNTITWNILSENPSIGVWIRSSSKNNVLHHNRFLNNGRSPQAEDEYDLGIQPNIWYDDILKIGNWWTDWDGIGNYSIGGDAEAVDLYPSNGYDFDGIPDWWEIECGLDPYIDDSGNDPDTDGLTNIEEYLNNAHPFLNDTDSDGLNDGDEVLVYSTNPNSTDTDSDGLNDFEEIFIYFTNATNGDTDGDGMEDGYEVQYNLDPLIDDSTLDPDSDGLTNLQEFNYRTNPNNNDTDSNELLDYDEIYEYYTNATNPDTDGDDLLDGDEINVYLTDPLNEDTDSDLMDDGWEVYTGTNPLVDDSDDDLDSDSLTNYQEYILGTLANNSDTDGDGMEDGYEVQYNLDPLIDDSTLDLDGDGLTNLQEFNYNTDPTNPDTDGDGETDGQEVENGYNPLDSKSNFANEKRARILTILAYVIPTIIIVISGVIGIVLYWRYRMKKIATSLGFSSVKEIKESRSKGFETKEEWEKAQKLGFNSNYEVKLAQSLNVKDKKALVSVVYLEIEDLALQIRSYEKRIRNYSELVPLEFEIENLERTENEITEIEKMLSSILYTINTYKIVDNEKVKDMMYGVPEVGSTVLKIDIPQIYEDIYNRKEYLSIFNKMVNLTKQFHPNIPININRIAVLAEVSQEKAISYLKDITNEMPEIGQYLELEQVFIRQYSEDKEIGLFYEKFKEKYQERIIQEKTQPACLFCRTEFGEIDQTEKLICQKCGKEALTCPICKQNLLLKDEIVREKNCGTLFHKSHITMWIRSENLCPICKKRINEQSLEPYEP